MTIWRFWISEYISSSIDCSNAEFCAYRVVCVCVCVRGTGSHHNSGVYSPSEIVSTGACVQTHTSIITVSVTRLCSPFGLELMVKLTWKLKLVIMVRGITFPTCACGVRPITMHWVSWPIRADCTCWKEGLCRKRAFERGGHEDLNNVQYLKNNVFFEH